MDLSQTARDIELKFNIEGKDQYKSSNLFHRTTVVYISESTKLILS